MDDSPIDATIAVSSQKTGTPGKSAENAIKEGDTFTYTFTVPPGTARLDAMLEWDYDWGAYPTNDINLILVPPSGTPILFGATLNARSARAATIRRRVNGRPSSMASPSSPGTGIDSRCGWQLTGRWSA